MKKQIIINDMVICSKCNKSVSVREGWIDPYNKTVTGPGSIKEPYVHLHCLSNKRKKEINAIKYENVFE